MMSAHDRRFFGDDLVLLTLMVVFRLLLDLAVSKVGNVLSSDTITLFKGANRGGNINRPSFTSRWNGVGNSLRLGYLFLRFLSRASSANRVRSKRFMM